VTTATEMRFLASRSSGEVSGLLERPEGARWLLVLGHGAGAGMRHRFMESAARVLAERGIATFRYQFPYMEKRSSRPDPQPVLLATVRSATEAAHGVAGDLPLLLGGKSMGGRMASLASAQAPLHGVKGLVFFGFPLHPPGSTGIERADHLKRVDVPMLFLQGTRDKLANLELLRPVLEGLGPKASLHVVEGADHSFEMLKRSGRSADEVLDELARVTAGWAERLESI